jgi:hypothetical protein
MVPQAGQGFKAWWQGEQSSESGEEEDHGISSCAFETKVHHRWKGSSEAFLDAKWPCEP